MSRMKDVKTIMEGMYPGKLHELEVEFGGFLAHQIKKEDLSPELVEVLDIALGTEHWSRVKTQIVTKKKRSVWCWIGVILFYTIGFIAIYFCCVMLFLWFLS